VAPGGEWDNLQDMSDSGFLNAIQADPANEAIRLIYADWLEERGDQRAEYLRLEARLAEPGLACTVYEEVHDRLIQLRASLAPRWLAQMDQPRSFVMLWPRWYCDTLVTQRQVGQPLRLIGSRNGDDQLRRCGIWPGVNVYTVSIHMRRLYVHGRMRVQELMWPDEYLRLHPDDGHLLAPRTHDRAVICGTSGTPLRFDATVPANMLRRFRVRLSKSERPLKHIRHDEVTHGVELTGITPIAKRTGLDLDFLLSAQSLHEAPTR
jgi:uncharacterized protein (TIGR02996 family)